MPVGAAIGSGIAGLGGAAIQSSSANSASKAAQNAAAQQLDFNKSVFSQAQSNLNPFAQTGQQANSALANLLGYGGNTEAQQAAFNNYLNSTNYNFVKNQGLQGIEYANAPAFNSGATAKALDQYNTGLAGNAITGYENMLQGQAGLGAQAGSALAGIGTNIAGQNANALQYGANAQGQAAAATGNAWTNALKNLGSAASTASSYGNNAFGGIFGSGTSSVGNGGIADPTGLFNPQITPIGGATMG